MARKPPTASCWSTTLRGHGAVFDDSSDDETDEDTHHITTAGDSSRAVPTTEEARLLGELDLASRIDPAAYKPNPWSIAKANASTRSSKPASPPQKIPVSRSTKSTKPVLDLLCSQRDQPKPVLASAVTSGSLSFRPVSSRAVSSRAVSHAICTIPTEPIPVPNTSLSQFDYETHIPSDETLVDVSHQPAMLPKSVITLSVHSSPQPPARTSATARPRSSVPSSPGSTAAASMQEMRPTPSPPETTGGPVSRKAELATLDAGPVYPTDLQTTRSIQPRRDLRILLLKPPTVTPQAHNIEFRPPPMITHSFLWHQLHGRHPNLPVGQVKKTAADTVPVRVQYQSPHLNGSRSPPSWKREWRSPELHLPSHDASAVPKPSLQHSQSSPVPKGEYSPIRPNSSAYSHCSAHSMSRPAKVSDSSSGARFSARHAHTEAVPRGLSAFAFRPEKRSAHLPPFPTFPADVPPPARTWAASVSPTRDSPLPQEHLPSLSQPPSPSHPRNTRRTLYMPKPPQKRDAYQAFSSPETQWSTIPAPKRGAAGTNRGRGIARAKFKIPRLTAAVKGRWERPAECSKPGKEPTTSQADRRVVTYIPPSRGQSSAQRHGNSLEPAVAQEAVGAVVEDRPSAISELAFKPMTIRRAVPPTMSLPSYKCPTPVGSSNTNPHAHSTGARSSHPGVSEQCMPVDSHTVAFDSSGLSQRYETVRRRMAQRKRRSTEVWDLLGLPSCGVVYEDSHRLSPRDVGQVEIGIVAWAGIQDMHDVTDS